MDRVFGSDRLDEPDSSSAVVRKAPRGCVSAKHATVLQCRVALSRRPASWPTGSTNLANYLRNGISHLTFELGGSLARLTYQVEGSEMDERRIARLFGLILGGLFACSLVLNAFAY